MALLPFQEPFELTRAHLQHAPGQLHARDGSAQRVGSGRPVCGGVLRVELHPASDRTVEARAV